jgi:hypothetical protein
MTIEALGTIFMSAITWPLRDIKVLRRSSAALPLLIGIKREGD